ncbi:hypothetical protein ACOSQ3_019976 [Xanthoceras sorbifolium]
MTRELISSNFSYFLLSLLIFLLIREIQARKLQQGDPVGCGDCDYELSCQGNKTILEFHSGKYYVKKILYAEHIITVVDANLSINGSCLGHPQKLLSVDGINSDNRYGISYNFKDANFVRCSSKISDPTNTILPCLNGNQLSPYIYVNYGGQRISNLPESCSFMSTVPIRDASVKYPFHQAIQKLLLSGFDLIWSVECRDCESAGGDCYVDLYFYAEIIAMTNHFRDKLGQGGFGSVYKGQLHNGSLVAVKVLENSKFSGEEFINEVSTIGRIHHANVVRLLGFCYEGSKRALVYEYMPIGSLDRHIFSKKGSGQSFNWKKLHEIALGTARRIKYLHNRCDPHNILLDRNFIPKAADFGLAKLYPKENGFICVSASKGTIGYIAPELILRNFGIVSCKSDVYSFGMLLELARGRRNSFAKATRSSKTYFPLWVYDHITDGRDLKLRNVSEIGSLIAKQLCIIGLWCIQVKPTDRPSITKVVEMLEGSIDELQMPPKPFFSSSPRCNSINEIQSDSSKELLEYSDSIEECSYIDHINVA